MPILRDLLRERLPGRELDRALASGKVRLQGVPVGDPEREVAADDVRYDASFPRCAPGRDPSIVHKGRGYVVVHKPARMLSVPAPGRREPDVLGFVGRLLGTALAVHRLDEETSGLMLVATDARAQTHLKDLLERHEVDRRYLAFVAGAWAGRRTLDGPIVRDRGDGLRGIGPGGQRAVTHVDAIEALRGATLVQARLETGRTHQVRVHLSAAGHAILGDPLYAAPNVRRRAPRLALHAARLEFLDLDGERRVFHAPLTDDLWRLRRAIGGLGP